MTINAGRDAASKPSDDETESNAETGQAMTAEEAMDEATDEEGFSDESAYTSQDSAKDEERLGKRS